MLAWKMDVKPKMMMMMRRVFSYCFNNYIVYQGATIGPLFILSSGEFVTRKYVSAFINISLPRALNLNTHVIAFELVELPL